MALLGRIKHLTTKVAHLLSSNTPATTNVAQTTTIKNSNTHIKFPLRWDMRGPRDSILDMIWESELAKAPTDAITLSILAANLTVHRTRLYRVHHTKIKNMPFCHKKIKAVAATLNEEKFKTGSFEQINGLICSPEPVEYRVWSWLATNRDVGTESIKSLVNSQDAVLISKKVDFFYVLDIMMDFTDTTITSGSKSVGDLSDVLNTDVNIADDAYPINTIEHRTQKANAVESTVQRAFWSRFISPTGSVLQESTDAVYDPVETLRDAPSTIDTMVFGPSILKMKADDL